MLSLARIFTWILDRDEKMIVESLLKNWQISLGRIQEIPPVENLLSSLYRTLPITFIDDDLGRTTAILLTDIEHIHE